MSELMRKSFGDGFAAIGFDSFYKKLKFMNNTKLITKELNEIIEPKLQQ